MSETLNAMLSAMPESYQKTVGFPTYDLLAAASIPMEELAAQLQETAEKLDPANLTGEELEEILGHIPAEPDQPVPPTPPAPAPEPEPEEGEPLEPEEQESDGAVMEPASLTTEELEHMAVVKLRAVARQIGLTSMTRKEIRFAKKEELLAAITAFLAEQNN